MQDILPETNIAPGNGWKTILSFLGSFAYSQGANSSFSGRYFLLSNCGYLGFSIFKKLPGRRLLARNVDIFPPTH